MLIFTVVSTYQAATSPIVSGSICWSFSIFSAGVPMALYAVAQNPVLLIGSSTVLSTSWFPASMPIRRRRCPQTPGSCLPDGSVSDIGRSSVGAGSGAVLVAVMGIIPAGRVLAAIVMVSSVSIAVYRQFALQETSMGRERMASTLNLRPRELIRQYQEAIRLMVGDRRVLIFMVVRNLLGFNTVIWTTYSTVYLADGRGVGLADATISVFPFVSAVVTMAVILLAGRRTDGRGALGSLVAGQVLNIVACLFFVISPAGTLIWALLWAVASALSVAVFRRPMIAIGRTSWVIESGR